MLATASAAQAVSILVGNLEAGGKIETQGRITFQAREPFGGEVRVICNKTMIGRLNAVATGTLTLGGNVAGTVESVLTSSCEGGLARTNLIEPRTPVRLSWLSVNAAEATLAGLAANFLLEIGGGASNCLYEALIQGTGRTEARGLITELELRYVRLLREATRLGGLFCPRSADIRMIGRLRVTVPSVGVSVTLLP